MVPIKAKITKYILLSAVKFPLLFPKWLNETGKYHFGKDSNKSIDFREGWEVASYFESEMKWKAVSIVCQISHEDLEKIHKWMRRSSSPLSYNEKRDRDSFKVSFENSESYRNIGWLDFGKEKRIMSLAHIEMPNSFSDSCYISISKFSGGLTYLSTYFMLKDSATLAVQKQDVKEVMGYVTFQSLNPFSRRFKVIEHHNRESVIRSYLKQNLNIVSTDIKSTIQSLFKNWKIIKNDDDLVVVADFCRSSNEAYFKKTAGSPVSYKTENHYVMIETWQDYCDLKISDDSSEHYCMQTVTEGTTIDAVFIKNQNPENVDKNDVFSDIGLEIHDSHLYFSTIIELTNKYKKVMSFVNLALISKLSEPEENHDVLFKASIELDLIAEQLDSINAATSHYCDQKYIEAVRNWIKYRKNETIKQNTIVSKRRNFSSDSLQVKNLRFNKIYSLIVGLLVIVQIVLACLTIEWSKYW